MHLKKQSRRNFLKTAGVGITCLPLAFSALAANNLKSKKKPFMVYVGTYAKPDAPNIFLYRLHATTGELTRINAFKGGENPSFLALTSDQQYLYAVNEVIDFNGVKTGAVSAFAVDKKTGDLTFLNQLATGGSAPCYVSVDKSGKLVLVANYVGGNVIMFPIQTSGRLGNFTALQQHQGSGPDAKRQEAPHAHCIIPTPDNQFALAVDLGIDKIKNYRLDTKQGGLVPNPGADFSTRPGAGPRHLTFHPNGRYAYLITELNSTLMVLAYNSHNGSFTALQTISTLPASFKGENIGADVHVSPNGKFLYASNRGHNSLVVFSINAGTGKLNLVEHVDTQGNWPRNFGLDPSGTFLVVANQYSNNMVSYHVDNQTGKLKPTGFTAEVSAPVCILLVPAFS